MASKPPSDGSASSRAHSGNGAPQVASVASYRPLFLLGHGGMGSVEAVAETLPNGTTRVVALKRILRSATGADASRLEMFLREARLTTLLEHPNVIRSLAYGESAGEVFLAMEYVAGEPLSRLIAAATERGTPLPLPVVAFILAQASEGLHAAHELRGTDGEALGVVHRDVSPQNVMVGYDGTVKLLDFGVAKIDLADCAARTKTGEVKGKTAYMSPEQAMGDPVDRRSDLYSLGAVLFECVTGRRMWGSGTDFDVLRRLALEEPPKLEEAETEVPAPLAALFTKLVLRDRAQRPATAHDVASELRSIAVGAGGADGTDVRATMTQLFEGERERREQAIARALAEPARDRGTSPLPELRAASAGESGPVFVTHQSYVAPRPTRRRSGIAAPAAVVAALVGVVAIFAFISGIRGARSASEHRASLAAEAPGNTSSHVAPPTSSQAESRPNVAPSQSASPGESPSTLGTARNLATPRESRPSHLTTPGMSPRTLAAPRLATPSAPASVTTTGIPPAASPAVAPSAKPASHEPPDVDPTPF